MKKTFTCKHLKMNYLKIILHFFCKKLCRIVKCCIFVVQNKTKNDYYKFHSLSTSVCEIRNVLLLRYAKVWGNGNVPNSYPENGFVLQHLSFFSLVISQFL